MRISRVHTGHLAPYGNWTRVTRNAWRIEEGGGIPGKRTNSKSELKLDVERTFSGHEKWWTFIFALMNLQVQL
jgi:hypothetical protein